MSFVVQKLFVNVPRNTLQKGRENKSIEKLVLVRDANYIVCVDLLDDEDAQGHIDLDDTSTFDFRIDNSAQVSKPDLITVYDASFNQSGDRSDLHVDHGKIVFRLDLSHANLQTEMEYSSEIRAMGALWVTPPSDIAYMQFQIPLTIVNSYTEAP